MLSRAHLKKPPGTTFVISSPNVKHPLNPKQFQIIPNIWFHPILLTSKVIIVSALCRKNEQKMGLSVSTRWCDFNIPRIGESLYPIPKGCAILRWVSIGISVILKSSYCTIQRYTTKIYKAPTK